MSMPAAPELAVRIAAIGVGATLVMDLWTLALARLFGIKGPDYAMVGRWLGHMRSGRFTHRQIAEAVPAPGERLLGWTAHYGVGVAFAAILVGVAGRDWVSGPTLLPALGVGVATVAFPFLVMQPAMGAGVAAARAPNPAAARLRSLAAHAVFGLGLWAAARLAAG